MFRILITILLCLGLTSPALASKRWNGSAWVDTTARRWDGDSWEAVVEKRWDGDSWEVISGGEADYCADKLGSYSLYYDADHPDGTTTACISGGTTAVTISGVTVDASANMTSGGTYGIIWDGALDHFLSIPAVGITPSNGRIELNFKFNSAEASANVGIIEWRYSSGERIKVNLVRSAGPVWKLELFHADGSNVSVYTADTDLTSGTAVLIILDWSSSTGNLFASLNGVSATIAGGGAFTTPATGVILGEDLSGSTSSTAVSFDDIKLSGSQQ